MFKGVQQCANKGKEEEDFEPGNMDVENARFKIIKEMDIANALWDTEKHQMFCLFTIELHRPS